MLYSKVWKVRRRPTKTSIPSASPFQLSAIFMSSSSAKSRYIVNRAPEPSEKLDSPGWASGWAWAAFEVKRLSSIAGIQNMRRLRLNWHSRFVAYLDHALVGIRIQDRECWYLEVGTETETLKGMLPGISREGQGNRFTGSSKSRTNEFRA